MAWKIKGVRAKQVMMSDLLILYLLGLCGWAFFKIFHLPVPALLGTVTLIGALRVAGLSVPQGPDFLILVSQLLLGFFAGSQITREALNKLREIVVPALLVFTWTIILMFFLGFLLWRFTFIDSQTALLASCVAGLTQMVIIALATGADVTVVTVMQVFRLVMTLITFPIIIKVLFVDSLPQKKSFQVYRNILSLYSQISLQHLRSLYKEQAQYHTDWRSFTWGLIKRAPVVLVIFGGGLLFYRLGVPAGAMIGAMLTVTAYALLSGYSIAGPPPPLMILVQIGAGIMISNNIDSGTVGMVISGNLLVPLVISTVIIFGTSFFIAYLLWKITGWNSLECLLAAAPAGFVPMTFLAISLQVDPVKVSLLHLCRIIAIKTIVPFIFMLL